jgi:hypothetical protein
MPPPIGPFHHGFASNVRTVDRLGCNGVIMNVTPSTKCDPFCYTVNAVGWCSQRMRWQLALEMLVSGFWMRVRWWLECNGSAAGTHALVL